LFLGAWTTACSQKTSVHSPTPEGSQNADSLQTTTASPNTESHTIQAPREMQAGSRYSISYSLKNSTAQPWDPDVLLVGIRWFSVETSSQIMSERRRFSEQKPRPADRRLEIRQRDL
jgi:hypothetical protein